MKKCGILTLHSALNYGAFLQAFGLQQTLKSMGYDVCIVELAKSRFFQRAMLVKCKYPRMIVHHYRLLKKFDEVSDELCVRREKLNNCDIVIVGSDEVWNLRNSMFPHYPEYFARSSVNVPFISYAVSANSLTAQDFIELQKTPEDFSQFSAISVRDANTYNIVKHLANREPKVVVDPTLLVENWDKYVQPCKEKNFILYYSMTVDCNERAAVERLSKETGKKIVTVGCKNDWCDEIVYANPFQFIGYVAAADYVVTSQFHGLMFSLIFNKQFVIFSQGKGKVIDAIKTFGLESREVTGQTNILETLNHPLGYTRINKLISIKREQSLNWLRNALNQVGK